MLRKIGYSLLCVGVLFSANTFASRHFLMPGISLDYYLPPNDPQEFINPSMFWTISATCTISTANDAPGIPALPAHESSVAEEYLIFAEVINRSASINETALSRGDTTYVSVRSGSELFIKASPSAKVKLTNLAQYTLKASCSV